jgi:hypothetical protein
VVARAPAGLAAAGVAGRCQLVGGSFFESVPAGADAYVLRNIIHDWEDDDCQRILTIIRRAMPAAGTLLVLERTLGLPNEGRETKFMDLNMLVSPGGRERTEAEFAALLAGSGFRLARVIEAGGGAVIEGLPV